MSIPEAKVVILGSEGVGKTSFIHRYVGHIFVQHTTPTIGASFFTCNIKVGISVIMSNDRSLLTMPIQSGQGRNLDAHEIKLLIWDTAGQERFRSMAPMYYRKANAAIFMFDITSYSSFKSMKSWVHELKVQVEESIIMCVVGNKCDMNHFRQVGLPEATEYATSIGAHYYESSALSSMGVEGVFLDIAQELIKENQISIAHGHGNTPVFQEGRVIRVSDRRDFQDSDEDKSFLCC